MATYAAMIEIMDDGIGEVIKATKEKGIFDNTIFLFLSDNGATNEGDMITQLRADLSNTPFRSYKQWCFQGGTSAPLIIMYGGGQPDGKRERFVTNLHILSIFFPLAWIWLLLNIPGNFEIMPLMLLEAERFFRR